MGVTVSTPIDLIWIVYSSFGCPSVSWFVQLVLYAFLPLQSIRGFPFVVLFVVFSIIEIPTSRPLFGPSVIVAAVGLMLAIVSVVVIITWTLLSSDWCSFINVIA